MRFTKLMTMLFGAMLFIALGATTASAMDKCGAGKCGDAKPTKTMKCGAGKCGAGMAKGMTPKGCICDDCDKHPDCAAKKDPSKACDCAEKGTMKCGAGKCGGEKPAKKVKAAMKCGAGKCG